MRIKLIFCIKIYKQNIIFPTILNSNFKTFQFECEISSVSNAKFNIVLKYFAVSSFKIQIFKPSRQFRSQTFFNCTLVDVCHASILIHFSDLHRLSILWQTQKSFSIKHAKFRCQFYAISARSKLSFSTLLKSSNRRQRGKTILFARSTTWFYGNKGGRIIFNARVIISDVNCR